MDSNSSNIIYVIESNYSNLSVFIEPYWELSLPERIQFINRTANTHIHIGSITVTATLDRFKAHLNTRGREREMRPFLWP
jgi:hypothetical protein